MPMAKRAEPRAWSVLPALDAEAAAALLSPPQLPAAAAARLPMARRAAAAAIPVVLEAPAAGGRLRLARALHALGGREGPLVAATGRRPALDAVPAGATLYLDVASLAPAAVLALEALLDDGAVWLLAGLEPGSALPARLARRLGAVVLAVPPLRERREELPALAEAVLARLARRQATPLPGLAPPALARLAAHTWPGDLGELEAVLGRALLVGDGDVVQAADLAFDAELARPASPPAAPAAAPAGSELEFVLTEMAHELRNPMVTIKTYARHLPALLDDAELRSRFETLASEAIERMDGLLENVLAFARLGAPRCQAVEVTPLVARVLAEMEPELAGRAVRVRRVAAPAGRCAADPEHLAYALRNLFAGVVREVPAREELLVDAAANGVVTLRFAAGGEAADRLRRLAAPGEAPSLGDPSLLPLAFRLARTVLERNGGGLSVVPEGSGMATLVMRLPAAPLEGSP